ncbi:MAG TPA: Gx transporter family protein [Candidatus Dorea intestinavium]|nr:Gx transporter family protein [Candidatus Dorea intestinavium]
MNKKVAEFGIFLSLALILSYVESLIPFNFGIPGIKLGLANLVIVIFLYRASFKEALMLSILRVLVAGFMFGNMMMILYSLSGAVLSLLVMYGLKRLDKNSIIGISMAGGVAHNMGQLLVAVLVVETLQITYYAPVLLIAGLVTGLLIGSVATEVIKRIKNIR